MATTAVTLNPMLLLVGRILMASLFIVSGAKKALAFAGTAGYFAKLGMPVPEVMAALAIAIELGGGILMLIGWKTRLVAWVQILLVVIATFLAHRFWEFDASQYNAQQVQFLKNLSIIGGLFYIAAAGAGAASVDKD